MISIVQQTLEFLVKNWKKPDVADLNIEDKSLIANPGNIFVTLYQNWIIRWSAGNIRWLVTSKAEEIIENTIEAAIKDTRFQPVVSSDLKEINIRVDELTSRNVLQDKEYKKLEPLKNWIIAIKKDYKKMAVILPNISPLLINWEDFEWVLSKKLWEKFDEKKYFLYSISTNTLTNY